MSAIRATSVYPSSPHDALWWSRLLNERDRSGLVTVSPEILASKLVVVIVRVCRLGSHRLLNSTRSLARLTAAISEDMFDIERRVDDPYLASRDARDAEAAAYDIASLPGL